MLSAVAICNVALSHIGDSANVVSIDPPEGSAQAGYCATFYPLALASLLEMSTWDFATVRQALAAVTNPSSTWLYAYAYPAGAINVISVLPSDALDDYSQNFATAGSPVPFAVGGPPLPDFSYANPADYSYTPQPYQLEQDGEGNQIVLTNCDSAVLRYTIDVTDSSKFSPLFVMALSYLLASMLAGPIIKGDAGATMSATMLKMCQAFKIQATASDANQRRIVAQQSVPWMAGR